ncbi:putative Herpesviridae UL52/UL70 DNA primase [Leishmania naiffi]|uniref:DNA-directed primase/polymerase protein n=1 Tax=Leishmania naiffi TaxID=5678 RepID=A0AAW3BAT4_9TRYP
MLWCKETFEAHFDPAECRLFPVQQHLFDFVDEARHDGDGDSSCAPHWLCFSIEFPSARDVSHLLSRHAPTNLFQRRQSFPNFLAAQRKRVREDFSLLYGATPLSQQSRMFLAATLDGVRSILSRVEACQLHLYEIIREGRPCHLYLDVEREANHVALRPVIEVDDDSTSSSVEEAAALVYVDEDVGGTRRTAFQCSQRRYQELRRHASHAPAEVCGLDCSVEPDNRNTCDTLLGALESFVRERHPSWVPSGLDAGVRGSVFADVWVLESVPLLGVADKFSQHYVFKLHGSMFESTNSVKVFVREFVAHMSERAAQDPQLHGALFFHKPPAWYPAFRELSLDYPRNTLPYLPRRCVIDEAVYSKNRMMRCVGSCKLGKQSVLLPYRHYVGGACVEHFVNSNQVASVSFDVFVSTLIAHGVASDAASVSLLRLSEKDDALRSTPARAVPVRAGEASVPRTLDPVALDVSIADLMSSLERVYSQIATCACRVSQPQSLQGRFLSFAVRGTRYCQNIGREHKSNNVYLVVDLKRRTFVQKCFDPECAFYRSPPLPLGGTPQAT